MDHSFEDVQILEYYLEHEPEKRREILHSSDFIECFSDSDYQIIVDLFHKRHGNSEKISKDKFLWNCVHLMQLYRLKTKPIIKYLVKSDEYLVFDELVLDDFVYEEQNKKKYLFFEFVNTFLRYSKTIDNSFSSKRKVTDKHLRAYEKIENDIFQMSDGISELLENKKDVLNIWNKAANFFLNYYKNKLP